MNKIILFLILIIPCISNAQMNIYENNANYIISGVLDYSYCTDTTSFDEDKRKDYELYEIFNANFKQINQNYFLKDNQVTNENVLKKIDEIISLKNNNLFIFYFAGHGVLKDGEPGMLMSDCSVIKKSELKNILKKKNNKQKIILLGDFCYSGLLAEIARELNSEGLDINAITSASSNVSTGSWSYTQALIDSFSGRQIVDKNNDGLITFFDMINEVEEVMLNRERQKSDYFITADLKNVIISKSKIKDKSNINYGSWYCSNEGITRVIDIKNSIYEVEYYNYNKYEYKKLSEKDLYSIHETDFEKGDLISVVWENDNYEAKIKKIDRIFYKISYVGWGDEWDEWITKNRITGNEKVEIKSDNVWYPGEIIQYKNNKYFIRYKDYDFCFDEWVDNSRIR